MSLSKLEKLLNEQAAREEYAFKVIAALRLRYEVTDKDNTVARDSATAGHVYSYLSVVLKESNSTKFQQRIKALLLDKNVIKPVPYCGILWFKGLGALKEDVEKGKEILAQHYLDRQRYRERQRQWAIKRWELPKATKTEASGT